jgi:hypothetical protein
MPQKKEGTMTTKLLLSTAALAVVLGTTGAMAQSRNDSNEIKRDQQTAPMKRDQHPGGAQTTGQAPSRDADSPRSQSRDADSAKSQKAPDSTRPTGDQDRASDNSTSGKAEQNDTKQPSSAQTKPSNAPQKTQADRNERMRNQPSASDKSVNTHDDTRPSSAQREPASPNAPRQNEAQSPSTDRQTTQNPNADRQTDNAQSRPAERMSASLQSSQKTRLNQAIEKVDVRPVTNVNFSISVGTAVPRTVVFHPVPRTIVEIIPEYRGYDFFMVRNQVVIVEPRSHRIVDVIERGGRTRAQATTSSERKLNLTQKQREYIRQHSTRRTTTTTGSAPRSETRVIVGEEVPEAVVIESFPEEVYREVPAVRSYRYIRGDQSIYLIEPGSRRVIEEID